MILLLLLLLLLQVLPVCLVVPRHWRLTLVLSRMHVVARQLKHQCCCWAWLWPQVLRCLHGHLAASQLVHDHAARLEVQQTLVRCHQGSCWLALPSQPLQLHLGCCSSADTQIRRVISAESHPYGDLPIGRVSIWQEDQHLCEARRLLWGRRRRCKHLLAQQSLLTHTGANSTLSCQDGRSLIARPTWTPKSSSADAESRGASDLRLLGVVIALLEASALLTAASGSGIAGVMSATALRLCAALLGLLKQGQPILSTGMVLAAGGRQQMKTAALIKAQRLSAPLAAGCDWPSW
jgi:hypothetical protein